MESPVTLGTWRTGNNLTLNRGKVRKTLGGLKFVVKNVSTQRAAEIAIESTLGGGTTVGIACPIEESQ